MKNQNSLKLKKLTANFRVFLKMHRMEIFIFSLFILVACIYWYPLPLYLRTHTTEHPVVDPLFNQWIIAWGRHALLTQPWNFFEANMFYPFAHTLAWGDHLFSLALVSIPLIPLIGVAGTYNTLLIASTALSGYFLYLFVTEVTRNRIAAVCAGVIWAISYFRFTETGHLQVLSTQWIPLIFLMSERLRKQPERTHLFWWMVVVGFLFLATNIYLLLFGFVVYATYMAITLVAREWTMRSFLTLVKAWGIALLLAVPIYLPSFILQQRHPVIRDFGNQYAMSLDGLSLLPVPGRLMALLQGGTPSTIAPQNTIGVVAFVLLVISLGLLIGSWKKEKNKYLLIAFLLSGIFSLGVALGPSIWFNGKVLIQENPVFIFAYRHLPGFEALRAPARDFLLVSFSVAIIIGWGLSQLFKGISVRWQVFVAALIIVWTVLEQSPSPINTYEMAKISDYPEYQWLAEQEGEFPILELPIYPGVYTHENDIIEARRMYFSTFHWKKRVSGAISPYISAGYTPQAQTLNAIGDDPKAIALLQEWGVQYVLFSPNDIKTLRWDPELAEAIERRLDALDELERVKEFPNAVVYQVKGVHDAKND